VRRGRTLPQKLRPVHGDGGRCSIGTVGLRCRCAIRHNVARFGYLREITQLCRRPDVVSIYVTFIAEGQRPAGIVMTKLRWNGSDALCPTCNRTMKPAELIRGLSFLEERTFICRRCGPVVDGAADTAYLRKAS
jgi:hypothetical protein